ncbi:MAG: flavin reductase [Bacteroidetes bacterium]|nr:flavin reductase [Bacteroidota bacterium]MBP7478294.1 flavin reductase [Chitinophagales bacterium]
MYYNSEDIENLDKAFRANLINCLSGFKPAHLIGTADKLGHTNLAIFTNIVHIGANPSLIGFVQRPVSNDSHTYKNIKATGIFTINHVHKSFVENAHYTSARFAKGISEFSHCKLTEEFIGDFKAPFVLESKIKFGLQFVQEVPIKINNSILVIGQIEHITVDDKALLPDGIIDLSVVKDICTSGLTNYYTATKLSQYPHAKSDKLPDFKIEK